MTTRASLRNTRWSEALFSFEASALLITRLQRLGKSVRRALTIKGLSETLGSALAA